MHSTFIGTFYASHVRSFTNERGLRPRAPLQARRSIDSSEARKPHATTRTRGHFGLHLVCGGLASGQSGAIWDAAHLMTIGTVIGAKK